ncbi:phosphate acetyltransferase [Candidatus Omnitrophota bacterium]
MPKDTLNIFEQIYQRAKQDRKQIVLPEGEELRVIEAAALTHKERLAEVTLLGKKEVIFDLAKKNNLDISGVKILNPLEDERLGEYVQCYWKLRKHKGLTLEDAKKLLEQESLYFGALMLREGRVDGFVAGAQQTTSNVARAALRCLKRDPADSTASGAFLVQTKQQNYGQDGLFLFADCAIVPLPSVKQLANIAVTSALLWKKVTGYPARVAMLSFSSLGSGAHPCIDKVKEATKLAKKLEPDLIIDGELQLDSAVDAEVAKIKVPQSPVAGRANILIFPNLDSGNIAYKLMQRLALARVAGPVIQGLRQPCSDLSRGCSSREIVDAIAITAVRAR